MSSALRRLRAHPWWAAIVVAVVLVGAGFLTYSGTRSQNAAAAPTTTVQTVSTGTIKQIVSATGTLAPASQADVNFSVSGKVTRVPIKVGQHVRKGQTLAVVESASLPADVASARATVAADRAKVQDDVDNAASATQTSADRAALKAARNQLHSARQALSAATLTAPITGAVAQLNLTVGQSVSGSSSNTTGGGGGNASSSGSTAGAGSTATSSSTADPQILLISTKSWIANATVDATSVGLLKAGEQAQLGVTGASGTVYGTIGSIGLLSSSTSGTASYPVVIDVTGSPSGMHDGADVTAELIYKQLVDVVRVSVTALHRNTSGGQYVEQDVNGTTVQTTVGVGAISGGQAQITSGLRAGDKIVVPQATYTPGATRPGSTRTGQVPGGGRFQFPAGVQAPGGTGD